MWFIQQSHANKSSVTQMNEPWHPHVNKSFVTQKNEPWNTPVNQSFVTHMNEPWHVTHMNEPWHVTHMNEPWHTRVNKSYVTHMNEPWHTYAYGSRPHRDSRVTDSNSLHSLWAHASLVTHDMSSYVIICHQMSHIISINRWVMLDRVRYGVYACVHTKCECASQNERVTTRKKS